MERRLKRLRFLWEWNGSRMPKRSIVSSSITHGTTACDETVRHGLRSGLYPSGVGSGYFSIPVGMENKAKRVLYDICYYGKRGNVDVPCYRKPLAYHDEGIATNLVHDLSNIFVI